MRKKYNHGGSTGTVFGVISCICFYFSRSLFTNPLDMVHKLSGKSIIPPMWLLNLMSLVFAFFLGYSFGSILNITKKGINAGVKEVSVYKGAVFLVCGFFLSLIWYPIMFIAEKILFSLIISVIATLSLLSCTLEWRSVRPSSAAITTFACAVFNFYLMLINIIAFFNN